MAWKAKVAINASLEKATGETRNNVMYALVMLRKVESRVVN
jgi:hypothetical protein